MGVRARIAVPREVLRRGQDPTQTSAPDVRATEPRHLGGRLPERPGVDHRILGIRVHIQDGGEIQVHPNRPGLTGRDLCKLLDQRLVPDRPQRHGRRKARSATLWQQRRERVSMVDPHSRTAVLEIGRHEDRYLGLFLEGVQLCDVRMGCSDRDGHSPDSEPHPPERLFELGISVSCVCAGKPGKDELAHRLL